MKNSDIAAVFNDIAEMLKLKGRLTSGEKQ